MACDHFVGTGEGGFEYGVGLAGLHRAEHVGHVNLKNHVHTALEVKAEAHAPFAYVIESVIAHVHFFLAERVHVVLVGAVVGFIVVAGFGCGEGSGLILVLAGDESEREIEQTYERQENSDNTGYDAA